MAKKKSKNKSNRKTGAMSAERFMFEKVRKLPIGKCYIAPPDWKENGITNIIVTRQRPNGNLVMATFLVDTFCLGVKNAFFQTNMPPHEFEQFIAKFAEMQVEEISYNEAHNLIYGAIAFAEEGGIQPALSFNIAEYILEEDTDDVPLIEYEFGKDGKHLLIVNPDRKEVPFFHILKKNLGDNFDYIMPLGEEITVSKEYEDDEDDEEYEDDEYDFLSNLTEEDMLNAIKKMAKDLKENAKRYPDEKYAYRHPEYPQTLSVRNQLIADELLSGANRGYLPREVIDRILALPKDEAAQDISNVILYEIGRTYRGIEDSTIQEPNNDAILHALLLLAQIQSDRGLDAVLEVMRQTGNFADYHLGDIAHNLISPALYACGRSHVSAIEDYLLEPGLDSYPRSMALNSLVMIAVNHPERRDEIIAVFRRLLNNLIVNLPERKACDGTFAGLMMITLIDIKAEELIPEIKETFATNCVNPTIVGDCESVITDIRHKKDPQIKEKYQMTDIYKEYEKIKRFMN